MYIRYFSLTWIKPAFILLLLIGLHDMACRNKETRVTPLDNLVKKYSQNKRDSLKLRCAIFLKENMDDLPGEELIFYNIKTGEQTGLDLDTISSERSLDIILANNNLSYKTNEVADVNVISESMLEKNINKAIADWNRYPWSKHVPLDIFLNFLLPYKVFNDYPEDWRTYFYLRYKDSISSRLAGSIEDTSNCFYKDPNTLYYRVLVDEVGKWFVYNTAFRKLRKAPSLSELMCIKQGDCLQWAYLNTYILRALGIPSTIDIIPFWGSKNGSHASEVFWDNHSKMRSPAGRSFERPAKVIRLSIRKQNLWRDSIKPLVGKDTFLLSYLQNNHWYDATGEHSNITNVVYHLPGINKENHLYAYICVMNYGRWEPVFYGKIDARNNIVFTNMGCNMLYQVAVAEGNSYKLVGHFFMVDSLGKIQDSFPKPPPKISLKLSKINNGLEAYVKKGRKYELKWVDTNWQWQSSRIQPCFKDSLLIIKNPPAASFYMLSEIDGKPGLERIFSLKDGKQQWW